MNKKEKRILSPEERRRNFLIRLRCFIIMICMYCSNAALVLADTNYGENAGKWVLEQLFWAAVVVVAIALIGCLLKRAFAAGGIVVVVGGLVCYFIKNPTKINSIGGSLGKVIGF